MVATIDLLDRLLDPISQVLTSETARRLLALQADSETQARMDDLANRCNEGQLNPEERADYESLISAANIIGALQAKARAIIATKPAA